MARTDLNTTEINSRTPGVVEPGDQNSDPTNDHKFANNGKIIIRANNTSGATKNLTFIPFKTIDGIAPTIQPAIAAGVIRWFGPFPVDIYNQQGGTDDGYVYFDVDGAAADVKFKLFKLP